MSSSVHELDERFEIRFPASWHKKSMANVVGWVRGIEVAGRLDRLRDRWEAKYGYAPRPFRAPY